MEALPAALLKGIVSAPLCAAKCPAQKHLLFWVVYALFLMRFRVGDNSASGFDDSYSEEE